MSLPVNSLPPTLPHPFSARPRSLHHPSFPKAAQNNELARCYETHQNPQIFPPQPFPQSMPLGGGGNQLASPRPPNRSEPHLQVPSLQDLSKYHEYHRSRKPLILYSLGKRCPPGGYHNQDSLSQRKEIWQGAEKVVSVILSEAIEGSSPAGKALSSLLLALIQWFIY